MHSREQRAVCSRCVLDGSTAAQPQSALSGNPCPTTSRLLYTEAARHAQRALQPHSTHQGTRTITVFRVESGCMESPHFLSSPAAAGAVDITASCSCNRRWQPADVISVDSLPFQKLALCIERTGSCRWLFPVDVFWCTFGGQGWPPPRTAASGDLFWPPLEIKHEQTAARHHANLGAER